MVILTSTTETSEDMAAALVAAGHQVEEKPAADAAVKDKKPAAQTDGAQVEASTEEGKTAGAPGATGKKTPQDEEPEEPKKTPAWAQKRFDEMTRKRHEAEGRANELARQLEDERKGKPVKTETPPPEPAKVETPAEELKPKPKVDDFASYEDFVEALTDWKSDQKIEKVKADFDKKLADSDRKVQEKEAKSEADTAAGEWAARVNEVKADPDYQDWDTVAAAAIEADVKISDAMSDAIAEDPNGPKIMYWLASHPAEAKKIYEATTYDPAKTLPPLVLAKNRAAGRELSRILAELPKAKAVAQPKADPPPAKPKAKPASAAPDPIEPVRGAASPAGFNPYDKAVASEMTNAEFRQWRKENPKG